MRVVKTRTQGRGKFDSGRHYRIGQNTHPGLGAQRQTASSSVYGRIQIGDGPVSSIQPILAAGTQPTRELARMYMERRRRPLWLHRQFTEY